MHGRLAIVTGTGTHIGKTHMATALLWALQAKFVRVTGIKPVESGVTPEVMSDRQRLDEASSFHVKQSDYVFAQPVSPHLAARECGIAIDPDRVLSSIRDVRDKADLTLAELAGGLFTPLGDGFLNMDLVQSLKADFVLLVAPDRIGVLHDVLSTTRAARQSGVIFDAVALVEPAQADSSTHRNSAELLMFMKDTKIRQVPRGTVRDLATHPSIASLAHDICSSTPRP